MRHDAISTKGLKQHVHLCGGSLHTAKHADESRFYLTPLGEVAVWVRVYGAAPALLGGGIGTNHQVARLLHREVQLRQQPADMSWMITDIEILFDDPGDQGLCEAVEHFENKDCLYRKTFPSLELITSKYRNIPIRL